MTLEEAIRFEERTAEAYNEAHNQFHDNVDPADAECCLNRAAEHRQLAEWLKELKERREKDVPDTNVGDTISRQAAIDILDAYQVMIENGEENPYSWARLRMSELQSAQPERKKGRWIVIVKGCKLTSYKCSECGRYIADDTGYDVKKDYPFCHCGADMRGEQDEL